MSEKYDFKGRIRDIPDWPKEGILFRDITPLLADHAGLCAAVDAYLWVAEVTFRLVLADARLLDVSRGPDASQCQHGHVVLIDLISDSRYFVSLDPRFHRAIWDSVLSRSFTLTDRGPTRRESIVAGV